MHRARLLDGREVAVKVQYPRVEELFRGDIATIRTFCTIAQPEHLSVIDEVERAFLTEFDYLREAEALAEVADNVAASPFRSRIAVPRPVKELCRKRLLVMEYLPGIKLVDGVRAQFRDAIGGAPPQQQPSGGSPPQSAGGLDLADSGLRVPPAWKLRLFRGYLVARDKAHNAGVSLRNNTVGRLNPRLRKPLRKTPLPLNVAELLMLLCRVHGHQIFFDGLFNGDCHPGNVLLLESGKVGLIDYGQAKRLSVEDRKARDALRVRCFFCFHPACDGPRPAACAPGPPAPQALAWLILALADGKRDEVVARFRAMGYTTRHELEDLCYVAAVIAFDRDDREITGGLNIQAWFEEAAVKDPITHWPDQFVMASRNALLLRGMGIVLGIQLSIAKEWRRTAAAFLRSQGEDVDL